MCAKQRRDRRQRFTALLHHVSTERLRESYQSLKKEAAPGVDGVTWEEYGRDLEARITDLHGRIHRGAYRARGSRRVWISKTDGRQRPLGIAALEDKIAQHAENRKGKFFINFSPAASDKAVIRTFASGPNGGKNPRGKIWTFLCALSVLGAKCFCLQRKAQYDPVSNTERGFLREKL